MHNNFLGNKMTKHGYSSKCGMFDLFAVCHFGSHVCSNYHKENCIMLRILYSIYCNDHCSICWMQITTAMNGAPVPAKTTDASTMKTEPSALPVTSASHIKLLLRSVRPTMSEATVRPAVSTSSVRPTLSESAIRPPISQTSVLLTSASNAARPVVTETVVRPPVSDVVRSTTKGTTVQELVPVGITGGSTITLMPVGTMLSRPVGIFVT